MTYKAVESEEERVWRIDPSLEGAQHFAVLGDEKAVFRRPSDASECGHETTVGRVLVNLVQIDECGCVGHAGGCDGVGEVVAVSQNLLQWSGHGSVWCCGCCWVLCVKCDADRKVRSAM